MEKQGKRGKKFEMYTEADLACGNLEETLLIIMGEHCFWMPDLSWLILSFLYTIYFKEFTEAHFGQRSSSVLVPTELREDRRTAQRIVLIVLRDSPPLARAFGLIQCCFSAFFLHNADLPTVFFPNFLLFLVFWCESGPPSKVC